MNILLQILPLVNEVVHMNYITCLEPSELKSLIHC